MIKRTLYFSSEVKLTTKDQQLVAEFDNPYNLPEKDMRKTFPIEDIGVLILDYGQMSISQILLTRLLANNTAIIVCGENHMPVGMFLNLDGHTLQSQRFQAQIEASQPLKKQLWSQTITAKIRNQAQLLAQNGRLAEPLFRWSREVLSDDSGGHEARAAAHYWGHLFPKELNFRRGRDESAPNQLLNYGYAILRAIIARALTGSGLLPTFGIHHRNQYNAYCLADDIMEPYRPFVDGIVVDIIESGLDYTQLTKDLKGKLLQIPTLDVKMGREKSPLAIAASRTAASLARCYAGEERKILYPEWPD